MPSILYTKSDVVSLNASEYLSSIKGKYELLEVSGELVYSDADGMANSTPLIFLSKHVSQKGIPSFTVHSLGNWSEKADLGGEPHELSVASPVEMLSILKYMDKTSSGIEVTYEATHHGPLTKKPSFFAEVGGNLEIVSRKDLAEKLAEAVLQGIEKCSEPKKIVVGIGGNHYPSKFTRLAIEKDYAFAHIIPRYYVNETQMLFQAFQRSVPKPASAVIEWKSLNSAERLKVLNTLKEIGVDYERV